MPKATSPVQLARTLSPKGMESWSDLAPIGFAGDSNSAHTARSSKQLSLVGKHVVFVLNSFDLGGAERQALFLAKHLKKTHRARVEIWGFDGPGRVSELCEEYDIAWRIVPVRRARTRVGVLKELLKFSIYVRKNRVDVLLPYCMQPNVMCCAIWRWSGVRFCLWQQRDEGIIRGPRRLEHLAVTNAPAFVAISRGTSAFLKNLLSVDPAKIHFVRNGVSLAVPMEDRTTWRKRLGLGEQDLVACMVANLHHFKDHQALLRAWRLVLNNRTEKAALPTLLLAGRLDDTAEALKALAAELHLGDSVRLLGPVKDISDLLGAVDIGVFSGRSEGCPNGVLECMASGLAVAATDIPGIRDAVGPDGVDYLARVNDPAALADRITTLFNNAGLRKSLGETNRLRVKEEFPPENMCSATADLILQGLASRKAWRYP
jgi:glycosyltransferase involved in cell wall biosynthesis